MQRLNVDRARVLRRHATNAECRLWQRVRNRHLAGRKFRRQHEVDHYIVDFVCTDAMLVVGLDGGQHVEQVDYDRHRTHHLHALGYRVLRFWNNDVLTDTESVLEVILEALANPAPHPSPIRAGEREI